MLAEILIRFDPVALRISDAIQVRWYGLAYVAGFVAGWWLMLRWARRGLGEVRESEVSDFITYAALFGVLLGGRLGYMLLYARDDFLSNPLTFFQVTRGGMASHGGIAGLALFTFYWARKRGRSWTGTGDNLCAAAPVGLFLGRLANFVNGELYGRPADVPWAMKFPEEAGRWSTASPDPEIAEKAVAVNELMARYSPQPEMQESVLHLARANGAFAEELRPLLTPRHPSQLYEALLEGLVLLAVLWFVRERCPRAPNGLITGLFFLLYALFRILGEQFREPDRILYGFTEGQFYSLFMIAAGLAFLAWAFTGGRRRQV